MPKAGTDWRDLAISTRLSRLKSQGAVRERLIANGASPAALLSWSELVAENIRDRDDEAGY